MKTGQILLAMFIGVLCEVPAHAEYVLTTIATFNGANGSNPVASLVADASGNLYGTTYAGGASGLGTVFQVAAGTHALTTLVSFNGANGSNPYGGLFVDASGNLYGTTQNGGDNGVGTVFQVAADTHALSTLVTFNGINGRNPTAGLVADADGNLYGTTQFGGAFDAGTVFALSAGTHALSTLATFNGANGSYPWAGLVFDANGNLYGTTYNGGTVGFGTVFKIAADTHTLSTLANFNGANGSNPYAGALVADADGNLYGTTYFGGASGYGTVFQMNADTHALTTLLSFNDTNGSNPIAGLTIDAEGNLYGTTQYDVANNGTVFKIAAGANELTTLVLFNGANGKEPYAGLVADASGNLYGTTAYGGANNAGTIFKLQQVPEPSTFILTALGVAAVASWRAR